MRRPSPHRAAARKEADHRADPEQGDRGQRGPPRRERPRRAANRNGASGTSAPAPKEKTRTAPLPRASRVFGIEAELLARQRVEGQLGFRDGASCEAVGVTHAHPARRVDQRQLLASSSGYSQARPAPARSDVRTSPAASAPKHTRRRPSRGSRQQTGDSGEQNGAVVRRTPPHRG